MKALLCTHYGTPDDLTLADIPDPVPGEGEAVVRIEAAALNFFDTLIIANKYQTKRVDRELWRGRQPVLDRRPRHCMFGLWRGA
jgi:NADPH:quinone reductase-like Zn-dependent oxidoreductase